MTVIDDDVDVQRLDADNDWRWPIMHKQKTNGNEPDTPTSQLCGKR